MEPVFIEDISDLKVVSSNGLENEVVSAKFHLNCAYLGRTHSNEFYVELSPADPATFTAFSTLSKDQVLGWVKSAMGPDTLSDRKSAVLAFIEQCAEAEQGKPVSVAAPWEPNQ